MLLVMKKNQRTLLFCLLLAVLTVAAYWPVTGCGFINFDDPKYVTQNPHLRAGLSWKGLSWAFTTGTYGYWHPLTLLTHLLDFQLYGLNAGGHHLTNLLFHTVDAILLFVLLQKVTGDAWRVTGSPPSVPLVTRHPSHVTWLSFFVAALFAIHPLHVQSVAWIAERKDVVSTMFFLLTLMTYGKYGKNVTNGAWGGTGDGPKSTVHGPRSTLHAALFYGLSLLCFVLGLMSKPMLVTLPFLMLLLDYWPLGRFAVHSPQSMVHDPPTPTNIAAPVLGSSTAEGGRFNASTLQRSTLRTALRLVIEKLPFFALAAVSCVATFAATRGPGVRSAGWGTLGERVNNAIVACVAYLEKMLWPVHLSVFYPLHPVGMGLVVGCGLLLAAITALALWCWQSRPWLAVGWFWYLGMLVPVSGLVAVGGHPQSMADRFTYLPLIGIFIMIVWEMASWLNGLNELNAGTADLASPDTPRASLATSPVTRHSPLVTVLLGGAVLVACAAETWYQVGFWHDSESLFLRALEVTHNNDVALNQYVVALMDQGKYDDAAAVLTAVLKVKPTLVPALLQLGITRSFQGKNKEAEGAFLDAVRYAPRNAMAHNNLGYLYLQEGRDQEAVRELEAAVRLQPSYDVALSSLANEYRKLGRTNELVGCYRQMIHLHPNAVEEVNDLAWILATSPDAKLRNGPEAVKLATRACELTKYQHPVTLATLAAACAEAGRLKDAVGYAERAQSLAGGGQGALGKRISALLTAFRAGHAYHG